MQNLFAITALLASVIWCQEFTLTAIVTGVQTIKSCGLEETGCPGHSSIAVTPTRIVTQEPQLTSTALVTDIETITSCLPEVVNCPLLTKTSTLTPATTILVPSITTGAVIFQNGTACSVYEATTITLPCSSCAIVSFVCRRVITIRARLIVRIDLFNSRTIGHHTCRACNDCYSNTTVLPFNLFNSICQSWSRHLSNRRPFDCKCDRLRYTKIFIPGSHYGTYRFLIS